MDKIDLIFQVALDTPLRRVFDYLPPPNETGGVQPGHGQRLVEQADALVDGARAAGRLAARVILQGRCPRCSPANGPTSARACARGG